MEEDEGRALFSKRFRGWDALGDGEKEAIKMILGSVHHIPLAIVGAAAFMTETQTPPSTYWNIFQESDEQAKRLLSQPFCDIQREADMTESILATYFITFNRITLQMPLAADLLCLIAFFDRQNIPEDLLSRCELEGMGDPITFRQVIGKLLGFSLVTAAKCEDKTFYELHRLVQLSLQVYLPQKESNGWRATALRQVSRLFPRDWNEQRSAGSAYLPHALVQILENLLEDIEGSLGPNNLIVLEAVDQLARALRSRGKFHESEKMNRRVLQSCEKTFGPDHPDTLISVNNLASVLESQGKYTQSEAMNRRALEGHEKTFGPDHPDTLISVGNLASVLESQGKYTESEAMSRHALEGHEKILDQTTPTP
ncbi:unnamed protein product [Tuber aestivum]|uniref:DUF7779 domain-containing protein n=1 Tax=Tuber aestivum TaxID=59557 RepID=A0A292Q7D3_9PEZI|nr:unnamed protein product [Tuber aestivum]